MVGVALVGCGQWGPLVADAFGRLERGRMLWLCDQDEARAKVLQRRWPRVRATGSYSDILHDPEVTAVVLATPLATHFALAKQALEFGKHVLVEKPINMAAAECEALGVAAAASGRILMLGHPANYSPVVLVLKRMLAAGELGELLYIDSERATAVLPRDSALELAAEELALLVDLTGQPPTLVAASGRGFGSQELGVVFCTLQFPAGIVARLHASCFKTPGVQQMSLVGSRKTAVWDQLAKTPLKLYDKTASEAATVRGAGETYPVTQSEPLVCELQHFLDCVEKGQSSRSDGYMAYCVLKVMEAVRLSLSRGGAPISIDTAPS